MNGRFARRSFQNHSFRESSPEQDCVDNLGCGLVGKRTALDAAHIGLFPL
jgi:hypothetical protein